MKVKELEYQLKHFFETQELPGVKAQELMAPSSRNPRSASHNTSPTPSAVLIMLYPKDEKWHLTLIKRNSYKGNHSAQISFPGGKMESTDANLKTCALRETLEEVGIQCTEEEVLGKLTPLYIPISNFMVHPYVALLPSEPKFAIDPHEVKHLIEIPIEIILNNKYKKQREIISQEHHITTPVYEIEDDYIWGATAMILSEFSEILKTVV